MSNEKPQPHSFEVFKKCSLDGRLALYLEKRDFYDHLTHVDFVDGLLSFDPKSLRGQQVHLVLTCGCRYSREDLDVLGLTFQKDLLFLGRQVWPEVTNGSTIQKRKSLRKRSWQRIKTDRAEERQLMESRASGSDTDCVSETNDIKLSNFQYSLPQKRLMLKLGSKAHPFRIRLPPFAPTSVTIQSNEEDTEKPCGVTYELCAFIGRRMTEVPSPNGSLSIVIRKLTYGPPQSLRPIQPLTVMNTKAVIFDCSGNITISVSLEKPLFYHEEPIDVEVSVDNLSCLSVRKVRVAVVQIAELYMVTKGCYRSIVDKVVLRDNLHISSGTCGWRHAFVLKPRLTERISRRGVAVDGLLKQETPRLASSTIMKIPDAGRNYHQPIRSVFGDIVVTKSTRIIKELQGIIVWYMVEARCSTRMNRVTVQLPFLLMHPPPDVCDNDHIKKFHQPEAPSIPGEFSHTPRQKRSVTLDEQNNVEI